MHHRADLHDLATIRLDHRPRTVSFENPTGAPGSAGSAAGGRKGSPQRRVAAGERVVLADLAGPGRIGHIWMTTMPTSPERLRAIVLEVFYDGADEPSIAVPMADFFGATMGRAVPYESALQSVQEGRGFNSWLPMPFREHVRIDLTNASDRPIDLYYQVDLTVGPVAEDEGALHVTFRRENPTTLRRDLTIVDGLRGPGRFLGCNVGMRVLRDPAWFSWYGEGEVKMFVDDDTDLPTWCGTGLEDYIGSAWGMDAHQTAYQGVPLVVRREDTPSAMPDIVGFYRWHLPDPITFERTLRVTLQQIGAVLLPPGSEATKALVDAAGVVTGNGWRRLDHPALQWFALAERQDDCCATAYLYLRDPQPVPRVDVAAATADLDD